MLAPMFRCYPAPRKTHAFSLVELIVSLAVLLVVSSLLVQVVNGVRERAVATKSLSNIRQNTTGLLLLANSKGGVLSVRGGGEGSGPGEHSFWAHQLEREMQYGRELFFSDKSEHGLSGGIYNRSTGILWAFRVSYGLNFTMDEWESSRNDGEWTVNHLYLSRVEEPSETIFMASTLHPNGYGRYAIDTRVGGAGGVLQFRYNGKALVGYLDGSASALSPEELTGSGFAGGYGATVNQWIPLQ